MKIIKSLLFVFVSSLISVALQANEPSGNKKQTELKGTKPNIIIWVADDQYLKSVGCYGGNPEHTPNIDKLASEGLRFDRAYCTTSICTPARSALYTGMYPIKNGAHPNHSGLKKDIPSMPIIMKKYGYRTGLVGKTGVHKNPIRPTNTFIWDEEFPLTDVSVQGADYNEKVRKKHRKMDFEKIEKFINKDANPFCLFVAASLPHGPELSKISNGLKGYPANNWLCDWQLGQYMQMLKDAKKDKNTLVIFVSDNGANTDSSKFTLYEPGVHIPMIAWWPGKIDANTSTNALVDFTDVMPTIMELAGGTPNKDMDGISLLPVLEGKKEHAHDDIFLSYTCLGVNGVEKPYPIRAVIAGDYKLIHYLNYKIDHPKGNKGTIKNPEYQLFDLKTDPNEKNNLSGDKSYDNVIKKLNKIMDKWIEEVGDKGMATEYEAVKMYPKKIGHLKMPENNN